MRLLDSPKNTIKRYNFTLIASLALVTGCQSTLFNPRPATDTTPPITTTNAVTNTKPKNKPVTSVDNSVPPSTDQTANEKLITNLVPDNDLGLDNPYPSLKQQMADPDIVASIQHEVEIALDQESRLQQRDQPPIPDSNAWTRLQQGMSMNAVMNKRVQAQLDWYLSHRSYLDRVMKRAEPILPFVLNELERKDLPTELALLPIVESAYQTFAYSHGRASGLWQIIPSTGRFLGLKQNWWYDGRRDIIESTRAATKYLTYLAKQFDNDWELTLASYNAGPGKVRSAIRYNKKKGRATDYWSLTRLRKETKDYVPKLLALKALFSDPEKYGIDLLHIEDEHKYEIVELDSQIDLALAAELADLTTEQLYQLNPAFNRWATAPDGPHRLLLPRENIDSFNQNLAQLPKNKRINWIRYKIRSGDSLSVIAKKHRTTTRLIKDVNNLNSNRIRAGKYLLIPTATKKLSSYSLSQSSRTSKIKNTARSGNKTHYTVKSGDSFWSISRKFDVNTRALAKWNAMAPTDTLRVGQKLVIWTSASNSAQAQLVSLHSTRPSNRMHALKYTVRKGDSLSRIASKFNIRVSDIKKWNKLGKYLQPGQKLKLYVDITRQSG